MSDVAQSTIAQAIYANPQHCSFPRVVAELESTLSRMRNMPLRTRWDFENVVVFDIGATRIVLGWTEDTSDALPACLLVSVGPLPSAASTGHDPEHEVLCSRLVERIQGRYAPDAVLWRQYPAVIEPELVDVLIDSLPSIHDVLRADCASHTGSPTTFIPFMPAAMAANDQPDLPPPDTSELNRVRAALYPVAMADAPALETAQMRLAAQAMNATLIVVWMPLGVAAMTYSLVKGEKIDFSARIMAVTGVMVAFCQTPLGQQVAALAGT